MKLASALSSWFHASPPPNEPTDADEPNPPIWPHDGENTVLVVGPDTESIQDKLDKYQDPSETVTFYNKNSNQEETITTFRPKHHFVDRRTAILFEPGTYDCSLQVGYYTHVLGLGASANQVTFVGGGRGPYCPAYDKDVGAEVLAKDDGTVDHYSYGNSLDTFWRAAENFSIGEENKNDDMLWAVSQAAPLRRVHVKKDLLLHDDGAFASGGHLANAQVDGELNFGSQQQFCSRSVTMNSDHPPTLGAWSNVFVDCVNAPPASTSSQIPLVTREDAPRVTVEKPFLVLETTNKNASSDGGKKYKLYVPKPRIRDAGSSPPLGAQLSSDSATDDIRDFSRVYVAKAKVLSKDNYVADKDVARKINKALQQGKDVVLSPGMYHLNQPLRVTQNNQVILGIGFATLVAPTNGSPCIQVPSKMEGVRVAGIMLEASRLRNKKNNNKIASLIEWGQEGVTGNLDPGNADHPGVLSDVFCRVGGSSLDRQVSTDVMVRIHSGHVLGDNLWLWRADHVQLGNHELPNFPPLDYHQTVEGEVPVKTGLEVNGDHVTIHGLAVEHTTEHQVIWRGESGSVQFYQCEFPYDVSRDFGLRNYMGYKVDGNVQQHRLGGAGVYSNFRDDNVLVKSAIEHPRVFRHDGGNEEVVNPFTVHLNNKGRIMTVVTNGLQQNGGGPALPNQGPSCFPPQNKKDDGGSLVK